ncbi:MAG: DUF6600 domain-containing protein [Candidatus Cybelea sp.]
MTSKWFTSVLCGVALVGVSLGSVVPVSADQAAPTKDGPGVARVSVLTGSAVVQRGDSNEQVKAVINAPLLPGDYISTGQTSRAELQFDGYTAVRLGGNVQARITNDDPNNRQLQLADGTIEVGLVHDSRAFQVDTPSVSVRSQQKGDYRVSITRDGSTWVTVRRGQAQIVTPQQSYDLQSGRTLVARGAASAPSISYTTVLGFDSFDDFSAKRDQTMVAALDSSPNVSPDIAGYDNLSAYGQWQDVAGYGQAWVPNQSSDWAPYQNGSWTWEDGYGWTWVSADQWGWAPYHYGRWTYANNYGWAWVPPAYVGYYNPQPAWSPALVGFFGFGLSVGGAGFGVNAGFGGYPYLGWYPLAPYAPYYPWYPGWAWTGYGWGWPGYGVGYGYRGWNTRMVSVTNINNYYGNFGHHGATGTLVGNFQHGNGRMIAVNPKMISKMGTIHGAVPVTPGRENLRFASGSRGMVSAPVMMSKRFDSPRFATNRALAARPAFEAQQRSVSQAIHGDSGRNNAPVSRGNETRGSLDSARSNAPTSSWQRFNTDRGAQRGGAQGQSAMNGSQRNDSNRGMTDGSRSNSLQGPASRMNAGDRSTANDGARPTTNEGARNGSQNRGISDSWSRFSQERGSAGGSNDRGGMSGSTDRGFSSRSQSFDSAARNGSFGSSERQSPVDSRNAAPSYARGDSFNSGRNPYAESRNSAPSYARGNGSGGNSAPSYARGNGGGSYPSYSRGNSGGGSYPSYSRGNTGGGGSAPRSSGGGGGGGGGRNGNGNGGGSNGRGGGGHPPQ